MTRAPAGTLYLIDGHAQFFRAYHAIRTGMTSPVTQEPTNLTYGFTAMLLKVLREYRPEYLAVVIDVSGDRETFRSEIYPEYKANRPPAPEDFGVQVERCLEILALFGIPVIGVGGVEADDVIATVVRTLERTRPELGVRIVSRDKDLTQLLRPGVELFDVHKDESVGPADIFKTEGVTAGQVVDILALMGDNVDNIPGVAGIGPKTAAKLILQYGSIDGLLEHLDEVKGKRRENIEAARDQLPLSRTLVRLRDDVDIELDLDAARCRLDAIDADALTALFRRLDFKQHRDTLASLVGRAPVSDVPSLLPEPDDEAGEEAAPDPRRRAADPVDGGLFAGVVESPAPVATMDGAYRTLCTAAEVEAFVNRARERGAVALDVETDTLGAMTARLCGVALSLEPKTGVYVPIRSPEPSSHLDEAAAIAALRGLLEDPSMVLVGHNLKYDLNVLRRAGARVAGTIFDTMIASYVIDATRSSHALDMLALALLDHAPVPIVDLIGTGRQQRTFDTVPLEQAGSYAAEDADLALRLAAIFREELDRLGLTDLFARVEIPLVHVLAELEFNGITVDPNELERQREALAARIDALRDEIAEHAPYPFNPDSPKQLAAALFNAPEADPPGLGLKPLKRGKTGPSTDQEVLEKLALDPDLDTPVPRLILEHRSLTKLVGTYLVALKEAINPATGRVHASFNQTVAATGRLSSSDPNLQNVPIRTDVGREVRRAFIPAAGFELVAADYSQIELRLLAHLSEDPALVDAFRTDIDIHTAVAAEVFGVAPADVTGEMRGTAKMVNFGIIYGITPWGLARRLGGDMSVAEAGRIIDDYKKRFTRIDHFLHQCVARAEADGYVETILHRRRAIPQIRARNPARRALGERMAINTVVQGSAADLIKIAMIDIHARLADVCPRARLLLQIHDELVLEAPAGEDAEAVEAFVKERMEAAMTLKVPLVVETGRGGNWMDLK